MLPAHALRQDPGDRLESQEQSGEGGGVEETDFYEANYTAEIYKAPQGPAQQPLRTRRRKAG